MHLISVGGLFGIALDLDNLRRQIAKKTKALEALD